MYHKLSICGRYKYLFEAIDNYSSFAVIIGLRYKSEVPQAIAEVIRRARAAGIVIVRFHTDNETVLHSENSSGATVSVDLPSGVQVTTGCEYHSRQNSVIERFWRTLNDAARPGFSPLDEGLVGVCL